MSPSPYAGLRVLDLSQGVTGPYCATLLALQGADVVKVEPPEGDWARRTGGARGGVTPLSIASNLGKRAIVNEEVTRRLPAHSTQHWLEVFTQADVLCAKVADYEEFRGSPQAAYKNLFRQVSQPPHGELPLVGVPGLGPQAQVRRSPAHGEHTVAVLREAGFAEAQIAALAAAGVIAQHT